MEEEEDLKKLARHGPHYIVEHSVIDVICFLFDFDVPLTVAEITLQMPVQICVGI